MLDSWFTVALLAIESQGVIGLRMMKLAAGGQDAQSEAFQMVNEKVSAAFEAAGTLIVGGSAAVVIDRYREHVGANALRLAR